MPGCRQPPPDGGPAAGPPQSLAERGGLDPVADRARGVLLITNTYRYGRPTRAAVTPQVKATVRPATEVVSAVVSGRVNADRGFDEGYRRWRASALHAELMGGDLPGGIEPFSFVPLDGLEAMAGLLGLTSGQRLIDLGCGRGGPGLWLAARAGARLVGVDASAVAIADCRRRAGLFPGMADAEFRVGDAAATELPAAYADAVVAIDVAQLVTDPAALANEAARLLRPAGRLVFTTWEGYGDAPTRFPRDVGWLLERAGLSVDSNTERPDWLDRQLRIYRRAGTAAREHPHDGAVRDLADEARHWRVWQHQTRRVVVTAHRPAR